MSDGGRMEKIGDAFTYPEFDYWAERIANACKNLLDASAGSISLLNDDGTDTEVVAVSSEGARRPVGLDSAEVVRRLKKITCRTGSAVYQNDVDRSELEGGSRAEHLEIDSVLIAPLLPEGKIAGLLVLVNKRGGFRNTDIQAAAAFAETASMALRINRTLDTLRRSETRFRLTVQSTVEAVISVDERGRIVFWDDSATATFGHSAEEIIGKPLDYIIPERLRSAHQRAFQRAVASGESIVLGKTVDVAGLRKDGSEFPMDLSLSAWKIGDRSFFTGIVRDVTERRSAIRALKEAYSDLELGVRGRMEDELATVERLQREIRERRIADEALRESETKYRIVADNTHDWEWWVTPDRRFTYVSPSCKGVTGRDPEEFLANPELILKIIHPEDRQRFIDHQSEIERTLSGGALEFRVVRPDGTERWVAHVCQPVFDENGRFRGNRGSNRDVTARRRAEDALRESERSLRELSSQLLAVQESERRRIAGELHDSVNQTLSAIKFALESKLSQMSGGTAPPGMSLESIVSLVQDCIDETRRIQMDLRPSILDDLGISATLSWFVREFQNVYTRIRVERNVEIAEQEVPPALKTVIFRIAQEALNNVAKHSGADFVRLTLGKAAGRFELKIEDNGRGFDLKQVFRGIGLISMRERTKLSGGSFSIESSVGKGTAVSASWPA